MAAALKSSLPSARSNSTYLGKDSLTQSLSALVKIHSVNPAYGGMDGGEGRVVDWVENFLRAFHLESSRWDVLPNRPNLLVTLPGRDTRRTLLFVTHVDTVSIKGMTIDPVGAEVRDGRLWGRGSTDAKGQVTAMLHALAAVAHERATPPINIQFALTIDEEAGFSGIHGLIKRGINIEAAVVGEPTELGLVVAHKGTQRWWIEITGKAAHSAKPHLGVNAIYHASLLIKKIQEEYTLRIAKKSHPLLGSPTVNVSIIEGGTQVNLVPPLCRILMDRRTLPGESRAIVEQEFEEMFREIKNSHPNFEARQIDPLMVDPPLETSPDDPLVKACCVLSDAYGRGCEPLGVPYGTDGSKLSEIGIPTIVVGPGSIDQAHTADEFIDLDELVQGARYYYDLMLSEHAR